jgi:integrase
MPSWTKQAIDEHATAAGIDESMVFRPVNKGGRITGERMTEQAIYNVVLHYADKVSVGKVAPHDLRRTFAKLAHKGGAGLDQIQLSLGHASIQTTERYLGTEQDLTDAPCDHLGLRL